MGGALARHGHLTDGHPAIRSKGNRRGRVCLFRSASFAVIVRVLFTLAIVAVTTVPVLLT